MSTVSAVVCICNWVGVRLARSGSPPLFPSLSLYLSLSLSLLWSLFSGKLRLLRRLARIFKYTRVLSLPLNHIFILYLFAVPPSTCTTPTPPLLHSPRRTHLPPTCKRVGILIVYILHFRGVNKQNRQQKTGAKYCEKTIQKKYETQRRRDTEEGSRKGVA